MDAKYTGEGLYFALQKSFVLIFRVKPAPVLGKYASVEGNGKRPLVSYRFTCVVHSARKSLLVNSFTPEIILHCFRNVLLMLCVVENIFRFATYKSYKN